MNKEYMNTTRKDNLVQRMVAMALCLLMCFQLLPVTAMAAEDAVAQLRSIKNYYWTNVTETFEEIRDDGLSYSTNVRDLWDFVCKYGQSAEEYYIELWESSDGAVLQEFEEDIRQLQSLKTNWDKYIEDQGKRNPNNVKSCQDFIDMVNEAIEYYLEDLNKKKTAMSSDPGSKEYILELVKAAINTLMHESYGYKDDKTITALSNYIAEYNTVLKNYYSSLEDQKDAAMDSIVEEIEADIENVKSVQALWGDFTAWNSWEVWNSLYNVTNNITNTLKSMVVYLEDVKITIDLPAVMRDNAETAWTALVAAKKAYDDNLKVIFTFRETYFAEIKKEGNYASPSDIYDAKTDESAAADDAKYATERTIFTWQSVDTASPTNSINHEDNYQRYSKANETLKNDIAAVEMALGQTKTLLETFEAAFQTFYDRLPGEVTKGTLKEWKTTINRWKYTETDLGSAVKVGDKYYSTQFPYYDFDNDYLFPTDSFPANEAEGAITHKKNGLELAYYIDCDYSFSANKSLNLARTANEKLWGGSDDTAKIATKTVAKLEQLVKAEQSLAEMDKAREALRQAWIKLSLVELNGSEETPLSKARKQAKECSEKGCKPEEAYKYVDGLDDNGKSDGHIRIGNWTTAAGAYHRALCNYLESENRGPLAYYAMEKLKALNAQYHQEFVAMTQEWKTAVEWANATPDVTYTSQTMSRKELMQNYAAVLEKYVMAYQNLTRQLDTIVAECEGVMASKTDLNPYDDDILASKTTLPNSKLGIADSATDSERTAAIRAYLRMQQMELTVWHDVAQESIATTRAALTLEDTTWQGSRYSYYYDNSADYLTPEVVYDLNEAIVEWTAYEAYTQFMLDNLNDVYELYELVDTSVTTSGDTSGDSYAAAVTAYNTAKGKYESAQQDTERAEKALEEATADNYGALSFNLEQAHEAEDREKNAMEAARMAVYDAAVRDGEKLIKEGANYLDWEKAYYVSQKDAADEEVSSATNACNAKANELAAARKTLSEKENTLRSASIAKSEAMASYSSLVTKLIEAKANLTQAEKEKGKGETQLAAYNAAKTAYDAINAEVDTASGALSTASQNYNTAGKARDDAQKAVEAAQKALDVANAAVAAAQDEYDWWCGLATETSIKKEGDKTITVEKRYIDPVPLVDPDVGERYSVASLELQISASDKVIESSQAEAEELYLLMASATSFSDSGEYNTPVKRGEIIFKFRQQSALRAGHQARKASLEEAMAAQYHPATLEGAQAAAKNAVSDYYYAKRAYDEFALMEDRLTYEFRQYNPSGSYGSYMNFLRCGENSVTYSDNSTTSLNSLYGIKFISSGYMGGRDEPEVHAMLLAGKKVYENYETRLSELQSAMNAAKEVMDQKLEELNDQEIAYEKKLTTEGEILQRQAMLKVAFEEAEKYWKGKADSNPPIVSAESALQTKKNEIDQKNYANIVESVCMDLANYMRTSELNGATGADLEAKIKHEDLGAINDTINAGWECAVQSDSLESNMRDWLNWYGSAYYYNSYVEYTLADAVYHDEGGKRTELLNRVRKMGDQYAMQVNTQATSGSGILFFAVVYHDTDGFERKEYIFPFLDAYKNTVTEAGKTLAGAWEAANGNLIDPTSTENVINQVHVETMQKLGQAGNIKAVTPLSPWSSDTFLFRTQYKMANDLSIRQDGENTTTEHFDNFEMFVERQNFKQDGKVDLSKKNEWSCAGMKLYKVSNFYGMSVYGYGGGPQTFMQLEFQGKLIGYLKKESGTSIAWVTDDLIKLGDDGVNPLFTVMHSNKDYATGKVGNSGLGTLQTVSDADSEWLIKLDFADNYGAGIEGLVNQVTDTTSVDTPVDSFSEDPTDTTQHHTIDPSQKTSFKDLGMTECLMLNLVYKDGTGTRRQVSLPVITSSAAWAMNNGLTGDEKIFGYAQQDNSVVFSAYLPEMEDLSVDECYLTFKYVDWTGWQSNTRASGTVQNRINGRRALVEADSGIDLTGIQIYAPTTYEASAKVEQGVVRYDVKAKGDAAGPAYMMTAAKDSKFPCAYGASLSLSSLSPYDGSVPLKYDKSFDNMYMLVINTDDMDLAGSESMPTVDLNVTSTKGRVNTYTSKVEKDGLDFYGYWPGANNSNVTVTQALGPGGQVKLFYKIDDIRNFDSVRIHMPENLDDDWQIKGIYLTKVTKVGPRFAVWENIFKGEQFITDRRYDRTVEGQQLTQQITEPILLQPGDIKEIAFENAQNPTVTATETDWDKVRYFMTDEEAQSALGFTKTRETYTVRVQVNDEGASTVSDGDCGSVNNFYFQLVFANGRSAYVLANQQLSGDGFRTGYIETFTIKTNRDYGELQAVRIIPDDNSADSDIFDKLNIKRIKVSRNSDTSVSRTWVVTDIGDNGWISFDYHDDAETYGILGRPGRSEAELSVNCPVSYVTYATKLLFALSTAQSDEGDVLNTLNQLGEGLSDEQRKKIEEVLTADTQYQGQLSMTLYYHNDKGNVEAMTMDVVGAMSTYANKVADKEESLDGQGNVITGSQYISNKEYMFRPGHTDRFEVDVSDVRDLVSIDLIPTGVKTQSAFWKVAALSVSTLEGAGVLNLNTQNEYEKTNAQSGECLCTAMGMPFTYWCPAANPEKMSFSFTENHLEVEDDATSWEVAPARIPESSNDTANVYVYTKVAEVGNSLGGDDYNKFFTQLQYTNVYGQIYKAPLREMAHYQINGQDVFFTAGVDIGNIAVLNNVAMLLNSNQNVVVVDKVVVQQIREGVIVSTYTMTPEEGRDVINSETGYLKLEPGANSANGTVYSTGADRQIVTVGFGEGTDMARLINMNRDVGIALEYTSVNDNPLDQLTYVSPYIYLTDQDIVAISSGGTAQLIFHEQYVDQVTGIKAVATGGLKANITAVSVQLQEQKVGGNVAEYENRDEDYWFSFLPKNGQQLSNDKTEIPVVKPGADESIETVSPFTVTLTTGSQVPTGDGDLVMDVYYKVTNDDNEQGPYRFNNVRNNLVSGGFNANQSATFRVMLGKNVETVERVELYPADRSTWAISNLEARLERTGKDLIVEEYQNATKDNPAVFERDYSTEKITVNVIASTTDVSGKVTTISNNISGAMVLNNVGPKQQVGIFASVNGAVDELLIKAETQSSNGWLDISSNLTEIGENQWTFVSRLGEDAVYRITVTPSLHPAKAVVLTINYKGIPVVEAETAQPEQEAPKQSSPLMLQASKPPVNAVASDEVKLNHAKLTLTAGSGQFQLEEANGKSVTWSSSDSGLATVENGLVAAGPKSAPGVSATITATDASGNSATCLVEFKLPSQ